MCCLLHDQFVGGKYEARDHAVKSQSEHVFNLEEEHKVRIICCLRWFALLVFFYSFTMDNSSVVPPRTSLSTDQWTFTTRVTDPLAFVYV